MLYNIIPTIFPLWNSYGLPFSIMHLKTQVKIGIVRIWKMARLIITIKNPYFCFTGTTTFVFDRGKLDAKKVHLSLLPVALNCNFAHKTVNQLLEFNFGHYNNLEILVLLSSARSSTSSSYTSNNKRNSDSIKKNFLIATTIIRNKSNVSTRITSAEKIKSLEDTILASTTKLDRLKERKRVNILEMTYEEDEDDDSSYHSSTMSEDFPQQVRPEPSSSIDVEYIRKLLEEQEKRHQKSIEQLLASIQKNNNLETPAHQADVSQTGGSHSNPLYDT